MRNDRLLIAILFLVVGMASETHAAQVKLAWIASTGQELSGYKLYYRKANQQYRSVDVGQATSYTLVNLEEGSTYIFAAAAYDFYGRESALSEELTFTIPSGAYNGPGGIPISVLQLLLACTTAKTPLSRPDNNSAVAIEN